jgi:LPXTG-motif cell wall-anchored protein
MGPHTLSTERTDIRSRTRRPAILVAAAVIALLTTLLAFTAPVALADGITWTSRTSAVDNNWISVTWGGPTEAQLFVAVANTGTGNRVMTSPDGITWTSRTPATNNSWISVTWGGLSGQEKFVAVGISGNGDRVMSSPDGITWTSRTSPADEVWYSVAWGGPIGQQKFVAVANTGSGNRVMTSGVNATAPAAPTINSITAGNGSLTVAFTAGADGGLPITNYKYSTDGTTYTALSPASTSSPFAISGLTNGTSYSITIKAVNAVGDSTASNAMTGTPTAPAAPTTTTTLSPTTTSPTTTSPTTTSPPTTSPPTTIVTRSLPETGDDSSNLTTLAIMLMVIGIVVAARHRSTTA